ncbi:probable cytochrome P450 6a13 [Macrosteles quadrilineatus]|uniref:probable cytochrome P450 6a13 n=1 Tax=Macrosteles quadrilineatus TaxID=74068 RepID=UPI0023E0B6E7|nr:probable cytochrome P450 6a13 [Macrosteles quadrilineatus]
MMIELGVADLLAASIVIAVCVYYYMTATYRFWKDRGVPFAKPEFFFGNIRKPILRQLSAVDNHKCIYNQFRKERFVGYFVFRRPILMIRDPVLIEKILVKDFNHFIDRGMPADPDSEPLAINLFLAKGQKWRKLRYKLTPTFTSGKLKSMFEQISNCGEDLVRILETHALSKNDVEAKQIVSLFTTDVIASCAFGLQLKADSPEGDEFRKMASQVFTPSLKQVIKLNFMFLLPKFAKFLGITALGKDMNNFFLNLSKATIEYREKNGVKRNDFVQLLINLRQQEENQCPENSQEGDSDSLIDQLQYTTSEKIKFSNEKLFTDECIAAQSFVFLVAGSDTTAGALSFILYAIAKHPDIQKQAQGEVDKVLSAKGWTYEAMRDLTYLDQVIQEGMRMYPIAAFINRDCTEHYQLPDTNVILEEGQRVLIPVPAIHMDPEHYPEPTVFKPERFLGNNYQPSPTYLPFGDGPRICIAMRFAVLEMKVCLARILSSFSISVNAKTQQPIQYDPRFFIPNALGGIWLDFNKRLCKINE